jgi:formylglycine-generating enzyme required for sulfatase activity
MGISQRKINKQEGLSRDYGIGDNYPVYCVSFYDAIAFCNKLSILMGKTPCYRVWGVTDWEGLEYSNIPTENNVHWNEVELDSLDGYRLPAEYEWEFAARGGDQSKSDWKYAFAGIQFAGNLEAEYDIYLDTVGWYVNNSFNTAHPVGQKKSNRIGLFDMSGNVGEICYYVESLESSGNSYVNFRGGSFIESIKKCTVSGYRVWYPYDSSLMCLGFRLVQSITE